MYKFAQSRAHHVNNKQLSVISGQFKLGNIFSFVLLTNGVSVFCALGNFFLGSSQSLCCYQPPFHYSVNNIRLCVNRTLNSFLEMGKMQNATKGKNTCFSHSSVSICARVRCTQWTNLIYYTFSSFFLCVRVCFSANLILFVSGKNNRFIAYSNCKTHTIHITHICIAKRNKRHKYFTC